MYKSKKNYPPLVASSQESAALTSALKQQDSKQLGKLKSTISAAPFLPTASHTQSSIPTYELAYPTYGAPMSLSEVSLAKMFPIWAKDEDWQGREQAYSTMLLTLLIHSNPDGWCLKMLSDCCLATMAKTSKKSLKRLPTSGIWDFGACSMHVISESPQIAVEFSDIMGDARPMGDVSQPVEKSQSTKPFPTLLAGLNSGTSIDLGCSNIVAVPNARHKMVERWRASEDYGFCRGLDATNFEETRASGNAICPPVSRWIAEKLIKTY